MHQYRRNRVPGGTYFFTVNLQDRTTTLLTDEIEALREAVRQTRTAHSFHIDAWVVLPDHMHCMWTLPEGDAGFSHRWQLIKSRFSKSLPLNETRSISRTREGERGIWQRRYWEHTIRDDRDYAAHMDYTHFNSVRYGYVSSPSRWPFSTFQSCVKKGMYPAAWAGTDSDITMTGERKAQDAGCRASHAT